LCKNGPGGPYGLQLFTDSHKAVTAFFRNHRHNVQNPSDSTHDRREAMASTLLKTPTKVLSAMLLGLWAGIVSGQLQAHCGPDRPDCVAAGTWEVKIAVGAGVRTNPLEGADDIPLVLLPQINYYGKRFFLDNWELGYTLVDQPRLMLNALVTPGGDGLYFFRDDWGRFALDGGFNVTSSRAPAPSAAPEMAADEGFLGNGSNGNDSNGNGDGATGGDRDDSYDSPSPNQPSAAEPSPAPPELSKRRIAGLGGLEASSQLGAFKWQLQALTDISGIHNGDELRFAVSTGTQAQEHQLGLALGFSWKSAEVMEYYYGVTSGEASAERPAYSPGSGASPFVRLSWSRPINQAWQWLGSVQYEHLSDAMRHSPLVKDDQVVQVFFGGVYHF